MPVDALLEHRRSASIRLYGLDGVPRRDAAPVDDHLHALQEIVDLTRSVLGVDGAGVNLLVDDVQVTVASTAGAVAPVTRELSVCSVVLRDHEQDQLVEIPDLRAVADLAGNPFVDGRSAALRFYAAAPLHGKHGLALGTLCGWSEQPHQLDDRQRGTLRQFGRAVVAVLDERRRTLVPGSGGALRLPRLSGA